MKGMNFGEAAKPSQGNSAAAAATVRGGDKKRQKFKKDEEEQKRRMEEFNVLIGKLTLANALQIRTIRAIIINCIKVKTNSKWAQEFKAGTVEYEVTQKAHKADGKTMEEIKEVIGIPSVWGFNKLLAAYQQMQDNHLANLEADKDKDQNAFNTFESQKDFVAKLNKSVDEWPRMGGWKLIHQLVPHCRIAKMYNAADKRLEVSCPGEASWDNHDFTKLSTMTPLHVWIYIKRAILAEGGKEMLGMAPAGDLERKIQEYLDEQKEDLD